MPRVLIPIVCLVACAVSACGYALAGRGNSLPASITSVGIPDFVNRSTTPDIDRVLTSAVRTEWQGRGKYRVEPTDTGVDAVLRGTIVSVGLQPVAFTSANQVSRNVIIVTASIDFREVANDHVIWSNPAFQAREEYAVTTGVTPNDANALFTQNQNALSLLSRTFSRSVVSSIFEAF
jgi:hypothetical protein